MNEEQIWGIEDTHTHTTLMYTQHARIKGQVVQINRDNQGYPTLPPETDGMPPQEPPLIYFKLYLSVTSSQAYSEEGNGCKAIITSQRRPFAFSRLTHYYRKLMEGSTDVYRRRLLVLKREAPGILHAARLATPARV